VLHDVPTQIQEERVEAPEQWLEERALLEQQSEVGALMERRVADEPGVGRRAARPVVWHWEHLDVGCPMASACASG
jgi:hypothetical protein